MEKSTLLFCNKWEINAKSAFRQSKKAFCQELLIWRLVSNIMEADLDGRRVTKMLHISLEGIAELEKKVKSIRSAIESYETILETQVGKLDNKVRSKGDIENKIREIKNELQRMKERYSKLLQFFALNVSLYYQLEESGKSLFKQVQDNVGIVVNQDRYHIHPQIEPAFKKTVAVPLLRYGAVQMEKIPEDVKKLTNEVELIGLRKDETLGYNPNKIDERVRELQKRLNELGYRGADGKPLIVDGKFGGNTLIAVNAYKNKNGIWNMVPYEGKVGPTTWEHLFPPKAIKTPVSVQLDSGMKSAVEKKIVLKPGEVLGYNPGVVDERVKELQKRLNELGFKGKDGKPLVVDGKFGGNTLYAVNAFKTQNKLDNQGNNAGKVGETSWKNMFNPNAKKYEKPVEKKTTQTYTPASPKKPSNVLSFGDVGQRVKEIQQMLITLGCWQSTTVFDTGNFGGITKESVEAFQAKCIKEWEEASRDIVKNQNLKEYEYLKYVNKNGTVDDATLKALVMEVAKLQGLTKAETERKLKEAEDAKKKAEEKRQSQQIVKEPEVNTPQPQPRPAPSPTPTPSDWK